MPNSTPPADPCGRSCAGAAGPDPIGPDRRTFLAGLGAAAAAALVAAGTAPARALAEPLALVRAVARSADGHAGGEHAYPIPAGDGASIDTDNEVILVRWQDAVYAFNLACPHQNVALRWLNADRRFQCPKHKSRYQPDGTFIEGRATRPMDRLNVRRAGDTVVVDTGALRKQPDDPAAYAAAVVRLV
ncbi:hypothetical protein tb265_46520 [Gemmatimonadetes bacterium T265]|nr:hypothetical protein tb265_46520 [Gemmatimonadetes bacterium T265]